MDLKVLRHERSTGEIYKVIVQNGAGCSVFASDTPQCECEAAAFITGFRMACPSNVYVSHETIKEEHWILRNAREAYADLKKRHNSPDISIDVVFREDGTTRRMSAKQFFGGYSCRYNEMSYFAILARYNRMPVTAFVLENIMIYSNVDLLMGRTQLLKVNKSPSTMDMPRESFQF